MSCGVGHRRGSDHTRGSDPTLLWQWYKLVATAPIRPLAWEPPYARGAVLEKTKRPKKKSTTNVMYNMIINTAIHYP